MQILLQASEDKPGALGGDFREIYIIVTWSRLFIR